MERRLENVESGAATAGVVTLVTVVLTTAFVGGLAFVTGKTGPVEGRLAMYVLAMGVAFVAGVFWFSRKTVDGATVLGLSAGAGVVTFATVVLTGEGIRYTLRAPGEVFQIQLLGYLASAGLIVTGLAYWAMQYGRGVLSGSSL